MNILAQEIKNILSLPVFQGSVFRCVFNQRLQKGHLTIDEDEKSHFTLYFLPYNSQTKEIFIGHHIKSGLWLSPGGHIDRGETMIDTLNREIKEELDMDTSFSENFLPFLIYLTRFHNPPQICREHYEFWYLLQTDDQNLKADPREFYEAHWMSIDEAKKRVIDSSNLSAFDWILMAQTRLSH